MSGCYYLHKSNLLLITTIQEIKHASATESAQLGSLISHTHEPAYKCYRFLDFTKSRSRLSIGTFEVFWHYNSYEWTCSKKDMCGGEK